MASRTICRAGITGVGMAFPERRLTNSDRHNLFNITLGQRGIKKSHIINNAKSGIVAIRLGADGHRIFVRERFTSATGLCLQASIHIQPQSCAIVCCGDMVPLLICYFLCPHSFYPSSHAGSGKP